MVQAILSAAETFHESDSRRALTVSKRGTRQAARDLCVEVLSPLHESGWQSYVEHHPAATLFHTLEWKQAVEKGFGHRPHYLLARRSDRIAGVLPIFEVHSLIAGRLFVSTPYAVYGGVLADDTESATALLKQAKSLARRREVRSLELRSRAAADASLRVAVTHATFWRPLPAQREDVANFLPRKTRAAARRAAERNAMAVSFDHSDLAEVWRLYARSMRRLGSPNYPLGFFGAMSRSLGEHLLVQLVRREGRPVAGLISLTFRDTVMPYFVGIDERAGIYGLSNYVYYESMCRAVEQGFRIYDFGRTRFDNRGSLEFKRSFGFEPTGLEYQIYVCPGHRPADLAPSSSRWAPARRLWRMLPLQVTRPVGGWLARSIPG